MTAAPASAAERSAPVADVVVVGLGPVGAVLAALLGAEGISVVVLEAAIAVAPHPRAIAADGETLRTLLDVLGPSGRPLFLLDRGVDVRGVRQELITTVDFPAVDDPVRNPIAQPGLSFFHQPSLERALRERLDALDSVRVRLGAHVRAVRDEPGGVGAVLDDGSVVRGRWLVGCDGAGSLVRRARGIAYVGRTYAEPWLVVDLDTDQPLPGLERFRYVIDAARPTVAMPRPGGHRFEFRLAPGELAEELATPAVLDRLLRPYGAVGAGVRVARASGYTFHTRTAARWRDGRVLVAGDAAHSMPPFGGQGLGSGVADAAALSWRLVEVCRGWAPPHVLDAYEREQRPRIQAMARSSLTIGRLLSPSRTAGASVVRAGLRAVSGAPVIGRRLRSGALRPTTPVPVPDVERSAGGGAALANPRLRIDGTIRRLDDVVGRRWTVWAAGDPREALSAAARDALDRREAAFFSVGPGAVDDLDGSLETLLTGPDAAPSLLLARPDRVVAVVGSPDTVEAVLTRLTGSGPTGC